MKDNAKIREVSRFKIDETNEGNLVEKQKIKEEEVE